MNTEKPHQQRIFDSSGLLPKKSWKAALLHFVLLVLVVFITEIAGVRADMVFDFQMKLAQKGNAEAQFKVGEMYEAGRGVEKNMEEALKWVNKSAAQGNSAAGFKLLFNDLEKNGINNGNKAQLDELKKAADAGDGYAVYYIGLMYSRGVGLNKNDTRALNWLGKASLLGITAAETEIVRVNESRTHWQAEQDAQKKVREQEKFRLKEEEHKKLEAQREKEKRKQQEAQREKEKRKQQELASREKAKKQRKLAQQREAERIVAENKAEKKRLALQKQAQAEKQRQAVMQQRKKNKQEKKIKFESDPCAGKTAKFLSTCR